MNINKADLLGCKTSSELFHRVTDSPTYKLLLRVMQAENPSLDTQQLRMFTRTLIDLARDAMLTDNQSAAPGPCIAGDTYGLTASEQLTELNNIIPLSLPAKKIRDYLLMITHSSFNAVLDADRYLDMLGVPRYNRSMYYENIEKRLEELRAAHAIIRDPESQTPVYVSWVDSINRIDHCATKHGRNYAVRFNPQIRPCLKHLSNLLQSPASQKIQRLKSAFAYDLYLILLEHEGEAVTFDLENLLQAMGTNSLAFAKKSVALQVVIRDPIAEINKKTNLLVFYEFGKRPIKTVTFTVSRK